jgi:hypothetical protein
MDGDFTGRGLAGEEAAFWRGFIEWWAREKAVPVPPRAWEALARAQQNVEGVVGGVRSTLLLGQTALRKLEPWRLDTGSGYLIVMDEGATDEVRPAIAAGSADDSPRAANAVVESDSPAGRGIAPPTRPESELRHDCPGEPPAAAQPRDRTPG